MIDVADTFDTEDYDAMLALKRGRGGQTGGGTGIGPGGGFGGGFGGGGSGFLGGSPGGLGGEGFGAMRKKRFVQGANGQIPLTYTPMKSQDTVPAMLSPGEYVVNNRAMDLPGAEQFVSALNAAGNGGFYAEGGPVPEQGGLMLDSDTFRLLLQLLSRFTGGETGVEMEPDDGGLQHFAWGGMVRPQQGGFRGPQMPAAGPAGGGAAPMPGAGRFSGQTANAGLSTVPSMQPMVRVGGRPGGSGGGGGIAPTPSTTPPPANTPGTYNSGIQDLTDLLKRYTDAGFFNPEGNPAIMRAVQGEATSNADAMRARQQNQLALGGMDAGQAGAMKLMGDLRGQGDVANALNSAQYGQLMNQQRFGEDLFKQMGGFNLDDWKAYLEFVRASRLKG